MKEFSRTTIPAGLEEIMDPAKAVLLVWDMQNDQAGGAFNKEELIRRAPPLITAARKAGVKIVFTRSTPFAWEEESPSFVWRAMKEQNVDEPSKLKPRRVRGSFGWQIMEPFTPEQADTILDKRRPTVFIGTEFEILLHNRSATTIIIAGCTTDGGVEATVRDGFYRGYFMVVVKDCVGTYTEKGHLEALKRMERFADVVESAEIIESWQR
ncbi:MAG: cysteine hydrolase [Deltaproteobacteria bacterium]|nr:cysteine hydrolase [Deltaproteobacteria bacterium]